MFGLHVGRSGEVSYLDYMRNWVVQCGFTGHIPCCQFYAYGPHNSRLLIDEEEGKELKEIEVFKIIHTAYNCLPLSKPEWFYRLIPELRTGVRIGAYAVVVHIKNGWKDNIRGFMEFLEKRSDKDTWPIIFFENHATKSNDYTLDRLENLMFLVEEIRRTPTVRAGLCLDTAHFWGNGMKELLYFQESMDYLECLPKDVPLMFHLNDSMTTCGSGVDLHGPVGYGTIWGGVIPVKKKVPDATKKCGQKTITEFLVDTAKIIPFYESGAAAFVTYARENGVPIILETGGTREVDKCLHGGVTPRGEYVG